MLENSLLDPENSIYYYHTDLMMLVLRMLNSGSKWKAIKHLISNVFLPRKYWNEILKFCENGGIDPQPFLKSWNLFDSHATEIEKYVLKEWAPSFSLAENQSIVENEEKAKQILMKKIIFNLESIKLQKSILTSETYENFTEKRNALELELKNNKENLEEKKSKKEVKKGFKPFFALKSEKKEGDLNPKIKKEIE